MLRATCTMKTVCGRTHQRFERAVLCMKARSLRVRMYSGVLTPRPFSEGLGRLKKGQGARFQC